MRERTPGMWVLVVVGAVSVLVTVVLAVVEPGMPRLLLVLGFPLPYTVIGQFVWWRAPQHPVARQMLATSTALAAAFVSTELVEILPLSICRLVEHTLYGLVVVLIVRLVALLPDGRPRFIHERLVLGALWFWPPLLSVPEFLDWPRWTSPPDGILLLLLGPVLLVVRYAALPADERRATRWLVGMALLGIGAVTAPLVPELLVPGASGAEAPLGWLAITVVAAALVVVVVRYRVLHVDLRVRWTTRYGLLWLVFGPWVLVVAGFASSSTGSALPLAGGVVVLAAAYAIRISVELAARVTQIRHQARELAASRKRIVHAQDTERRRIERHLHDGIQQDLVVLVTRLRLARNKLPSADRTGVALKDIQDDIYRVIDELRELAHGIHPAELTDQGLAAAVRSRARRAPIPITVVADPVLDTTRYATDVEESAFFLVSEALTNVLKHANATQATTRLTQTAGTLLVEITDDGIGLPRDHREGSGLIGLQDRIDAIGGTLEVTGGPGGGTTVRARLPALETTDA